MYPVAFVLCAASVLSLSATAPALEVRSDEVVAPLPRVRVCPGSSATSGSSIATWTRGDNCSEKPFLPRGANYVRLNQTSVGQWTEYGGSKSGRSGGGFGGAPGNAYHSTFSVGHWNRSEANEALAHMSSLSFNLVRVFIDDGRTLCGLHDGAAGAAGDRLSLVPVIPCTPETSRPNGVNGPFFPGRNNKNRSSASSGSSSSSAIINNASSNSRRASHRIDAAGIAQPDWLSSQYMDNFAEFVILAATHGVYVMPTLQRFPCNAHFAALVQDLNVSRVSEGNSDYLYEPAVQAKAVYLASFVQALKNRIGADLLTTIFGFSLENEARAYGNEPPFNLGDTLVLDAHGVARNMSLPGDRRALLDVGFAHWADASAAAVWAEDGDAMVTAGMFTYFAVGWPNITAPGPVVSGRDQRFPPDPAFLSTHSELSYLDIHIYPTNPSAFNFSSDALSENFAHIERRRVPLLMGEFGAFRKSYSTFAAAVEVLKDTVSQACSAEFGFQGWLVWTWDCFEQSWMLWNLADTGDVNGTNTSLAEQMSLLATSK